jgi:lysosomal alpha-mannosidase
MTFGDDFQYRNAENWFSNLDKLIDAIHETHPDVHAFYSTPSCYISAVNELNHTFSVRDNDYFPYGRRSGFYTSRPSLKRQERDTNNLLQISKQLDAIARSVDSEPFVDEGRNELAILQHHDAIPGLATQSTANDFVKRLFSASEALKVVVDRAYKKLLIKNSKPEHKQIVCDTLNITECYVSENNQNFTLIIYNPIGRSIAQWIRIPVPSDDIYEIFDTNGVKVEKTYTIPISKSVQQLQGRKSLAKYELAFKANLLGVGFVTYFVKKTSNFFPNLIKNL